MKDHLNTSVSRALLILECFSPTQPQLTWSEIQRLSNIPRSTVFRLLTTLTGLNYLKHDAESKKYFLGPKVLTLGFTVLQNQEGREIARPYLQKLSRELNKTVNLLVLDKTEMVIIERIRVPSLRDLSIGIGSRIPLHNTASGQVFLAYLSSERLLEVIRQIKKDPRIVQYVGKNGEKLDLRLAEIRRHGYALNDEESERGIRALAVPIFSSEGVVYAMHIVSASEEISVDDLEHFYAPRLMEMGRKISEALGHREGEQSY